MASMAQLLLPPKEAGKIKAAYDIQQKAGGIGGKVSGQIVVQRELGKSGLRALYEAEKILGKDPSQILKAALPGKLGARSYDSAAHRAVEGLLRARSGAAVPETEVRRYMENYLPKVGDTAKDVQSKLSAFRKDLEAQASIGSGSNTDTAEQLLQALGI